MGRYFDVNNESVINLTANLEKLNRSAFPSAVRNTLNKGAFETKKNIPEIGAKRFITRNKTFLKRFSTVDKAKGFNVNKMVATVGIDSRQNKKIAENMEAQEFGGSVNAGKLMPHDEARTSNSYKKQVRRKNSLNKVQVHNATKAFKAHRGSKRSKFVAAVMSTAKSGKGYMLIHAGATGMIYEVKGLNQNIKTGKVKFKAKKLYAVRNTRNNNVKATGFVLKSATLASKDMVKYYIDNAEFQFKKQLRQR